MNSSTSKQMQTYDDSGFHISSYFLKIFFFFKDSGSEVGLMKAQSPRGCFLVCGVRKHYSHARWFPAVNFLRLTLRVQLLMTVSISDVNINF